MMEMPLPVPDEEQLPPPRTMTQDAYLRAIYPAQIREAAAAICQLRPERYSRRVDARGVITRWLNPEIQGRIEQHQAWGHRRQAFLLAEHDEPAGGEPCQHRPPHGVVMPDPADRTKRVLVVLHHHPVAPSQLDRCGLVAVLCAHGLQPPPGTDPRLLGADAKYRGKTFIRGRYVDISGRCPACHGWPMPPEALIPAADVRCAHTAVLDHESRQQA
jgi:hypothetical protein